MPTPRDRVGDAAGAAALAEDAVHRLRSVGLEDHRAALDARRTLEQATPVLTVAAPSTGVVPTGSPIQ